MAPAMQQLYSCLFLTFEYHSVSAPSSDRIIYLGIEVTEASLRGSKLSTLEHAVRFVDIRSRKRLKRIRTHSTMED